MKVINNRQYNYIGRKFGFFVFTEKDDSYLLVSHAKYITEDGIFFFRIDGSIEPSYSMQKSKSSSELATICEKYLIVRNPMTWKDRLIPDGEQSRTETILEASVVVK